MWYMALCFWIGSCNYTLPIQTWDWHMWRAVRGRGGCWTSEWPREHSSYIGMYSLCIVVWGMQIKLDVPWASSQAT